MVKRELLLALFAWAHLPLLFIDKEVAFCDAVEKHGNDVRVLMEGWHAVSLHHVSDEGLRVRLRAQELLDLVDFGVKKNARARFLVKRCDAVPGLGAVARPLPSALSHGFFFGGHCIDFIEDV